LRFVETYGPFGSSEEAQFMCGWRHNETLLDYVQRINGYLLLKMSEPWRQRAQYSAQDASVSRDEPSAARAPAAKPYISARSNVV